MLISTVRKNTPTLAWSVFIDVSEERAYFSLHRIEDPDDLGRTSLRNGQYTSTGMHRVTSYYVIPRLVNLKSLMLSS
jgi:hypothetical protein